MSHIKLFEQYGQSYRRVIPRDFFNEGKLLKCMGVLALAVLDKQVPEGIEIDVEETMEAFEIELDEALNHLRVVNYPVYVNGEQYEVGTVYNSKDPFPFYIVDAEEYAEYLIFDDNGKFSDEFIEHFTK